MLALETIIANFSLKTMKVQLENFILNNVQNFENFKM